MSGPTSGPAANGMAIGSPFPARPSLIASISKSRPFRAPNNLDLFVIGNDNRVWTTFWAGNWNSDFFPLPGKMVFDHQHQQIAAVSRGANNLDLFAFGVGGHAWQDSWKPHLGA